MGLIFQASNGVYYNSDIFQAYHINTMVNVVSSKSYFDPLTLSTKRHETASYSICGSLEVDELHCDCNIVLATFDTEKEANEALISLIKNINNCGAFDDIFTFKEVL